MLLDLGAGWPLLALLPFVVVGFVVAIVARRPPVWRRITGGVLAGLASFLMVGAAGYVHFVQTVGFDASTAAPTAFAMALVGAAVGGLAVLVLRWRLPRADGARTL